MGIETESFFIGRMAKQNFLVSIPPVCHINQHFMILYMQIYFIPHLNTEICWLFHTHARTKYE
jgi:hypothetical protein